jgi:arsenate reductase (glutaredoxin)
MDHDLIIYTYANCSTCRDATKWLKAREIPFKERPIRETPPNLTELRAMLAAFEGQITRLFNTSGDEYRALGLKSKMPGLSPGEALALLASNGRLVKRPFVIGSDIHLLGFKEAVWEKAFTQRSRG